MLPRLNRRRAMFVLTKIDEILMWEQRKESERDTRFVELGRYLCEVRAGQYWRLENLKSFDDFLEKRFPESRRKAYYLMSIHEHLPPQVRKELKEVGWTKGLELAKLARRDGQEFDCATWLHKARAMPKDGIPAIPCTKHWFALTSVQIRPAPMPSGAQVSGSPVADYRQPE
jgi:hypothetical protein